MRSSLPSNCRNSTPPISISTCRASIPRRSTICWRFPEEEMANDTPPVPEHPASRSGDLWICGKHRILCGDSTKPEDVARLLGERKPLLMVTDPPYGIELDSEWRDRAGLN